MNKSESKYFNTAIRFDKALLSLIENKPFEYITVSEICEKAKVNRSTFYLHYENTSDLLKETISYVVNDFYSYFSVDKKSITEKFADSELNDLIYINDKYLRPYLLFIKNNQRLFGSVLSQPGTFDSDKIFQRLLENIFAPILDRFHYPKNEQNYVMMFYLNGITAIIKEWLKEDCEKSIEEISHIIHYCVFGRT